MREFRFLEDKRNASGLSEAEEGRWRELASQLHTQPEPAVSADPVQYAQSLIEQGYDPVQAYLHVGFTLDQIAAAGYDTTAYVQAASDPQSYAQALLAQGYDAATAYAAAGLPVPSAESGAASQNWAALVPDSPAEPEFADAELVADVFEEPGTGGWTASSPGEVAPAREQPSMAADPWRSPAPAAEELPAPPASVPLVDDQPAAAEPPQQNAWGIEARDEVAKLPSEAIADPFAPVAPLPLPEGVVEAKGPDAESPSIPPEPAHVESAPAVEPVPAPEPSAAQTVLNAPAFVDEPAPEVEEAPVLEAASVVESAPVFEAAPVEPSNPPEAPAAHDPNAGLEGIREVDFGADSPALETYAPDERPAPLAPQALEFGVVEGLAAETSEPAPELAAVESTVTSAEPAAELATPTESDDPVDQIEVTPAEPVSVSDLILSSTPSAPEAAPFVAASPEPEPVPVVEPSPAIIEESIELDAVAIVEEAPAVEAPVASPVLGLAEAAPVVEAFASESGPAVSITEELPVIEAAVTASAPEAAPAEAQISQAPVAPAEDAAATPSDGPPWPTRSELSEWNSADKAEYVAWSYNSGGIEPFAEAPLDAQAISANADVPVIPPNEPAPAAEPSWMAPDRVPTEYEPQPLAEMAVESADVEVVEELEVVAAEPAPSSNADGLADAPTEDAPASEPAVVLEAAPVVEAAAFQETVPAIEPEPILEAAPVLEAEPILEAAPVLEAEPILEAEPAPQIEGTVIPGDDAVVIDESEFAAPAPPPPAPIPAPVVPGENRVIVHLVEGAVKRGTVHDVDLGAPNVVLHSQLGAESIPRERIKAVFFMLPIGAPPPPVEGTKLRITFHDGRQLVGYSNAYDGQNTGFFVVPADARTNTQRIYVYQGAIRQVARG